MNRWDPDNHVTLGDYWTFLQSQGIDVRDIDRVMCARGRTTIHFKNGKRRRVA